MTPLSSLSTSLDLETETASQETVPSIVLAALLSPGRRHAAWAAQWILLGIARSVNRLSG